MSIILLILGIILFVGLVVIHEFGHFLAARRNGVDVEEFGIGFPPRAWKHKTKKGFIFSLNWLPIGGFVKLKGETDSATEKGTFGAASFKAKSKIMLAGVGMNLLVAFLLLTFVALMGMPKIVENQFTVASDTKVTKNDVLVGYIVPESPAEQSGLQVRDRLVSIQLASDSSIERTVDSDEALPEITKEFAGQQVVINYERSGQIYASAVQLKSQQEVDGNAYLGIAPAEFTLQQSTWSAPIVAVGLIKQFTVLTFQGLGTAIGALFQGDTAKASEQVSGPVGIIAVLKQGSLLGYQFILFIVAIISLSLAIMNVLPIPALDGGRFYVILLSRMFGKRLSQDMEERIVGAGFVFLIGLIIIITVVDVRRFF